MLIRRCLVVILLLAGAGLVTIQFWIPVFIYRPTTLDRSDPRAWGLPEAVAMKASYGNGTGITGWWFRPARKDAPVVLLVHGRSANISSRSSVMQHLASQGLGVFLFDYRGYGASIGQPSEENLFQDTLTAYRWLRQQGVQTRHIVVVGQSLGNSPATKLAARQPVGALLLISPFTSLPDALSDRLPWLPVRLVPWLHNRFDVEVNLMRFGGRVLLVASKDDGLVPTENVRRFQDLKAQWEWLDASPLRHEGMLQALAEDGRLARAIHALIPTGISNSNSTGL